MNNFTSLSTAVIKIIDEYPVGYQFHGNELRDDVVRIYPESQYSYVDTFLRMARRHRRDSFRVVDQNNSLYEKVHVKPIIEEIKEIIPQKEPPAKCKEVVRQIELPFLFNQLFLAGFFAVLLGAFLPVDFDFGRPLAPPSLIAFKSASVYTPAEPMYLRGDLFALWSLLFTATEDIFRAIAISCTVSRDVFSSIYNSLKHFLSANQWQKWKKSKLLDILLYNRIVKNQKNCNFSKIFGTNLDNLLGRGYIYNISVPTFGHINKRQPEAPVADSPIEGEGEFYERNNCKRIYPKLRKRQV
jgi:hypothetical protein